ncbi:MAG: DUF4349 domain-containing protein [Treponema sp.]|nr:DUF4349 domain-containing protein [Treponema sp.]
MKKLLFVTILALTALFVSCSKKYSASQSKSLAALHETADGAFSGTGYNPETPASAEDAKAPTLPTGRKLIFTGTINLEVESLEKTQASVQKWVHDFGGYISESSMGARSANFTARIPSASFESAMEQASTFGTILLKNIESSDVTDEFYDLKSRLETKKVLLERLQNYLKNATAIKDMMEIETKINDVTSDLERMQGQMNRLSGKIDFATVNISAKLPANHTEEGFALPNAGEKAKDLFGGFISFIINLIFVLLYIVFYGIPIILVVALFYWICFGKLGLLRKLFRKISVHKVKEPASKQEQPKTV